jgi:hypothetical protein
MYLNQIHRNNFRLSLYFPSVHSHIEHLSNKLRKKIVITKRIWRKIENISITSINRELEVECMNVLIFRYFLFPFNIDWMTICLIFYGDKLEMGLNFLEENFCFSSSYKLYYFGYNQVITWTLSTLV